MAQYAFKLPDIGEGIAEAEIACWRVAVGDRVEEDQPLADMLTEKAAVEIPSPVSGRVIQLNGQAGDKVAIGSVLVLLEVEGESSGELPPAGVAKPAAPPPPAPVAAAPPPKPVTGQVPAAPAAPVVPRAAGEKPVASPAVRRRAQELGILLSYVQGSGKAGRITQEDLERFAAGGAVGSAPLSTARGPRDAVHEIRIIGLRRKIAEAMQRSKQRIPHFAYVEEVDVTALEEARAQLNANRRKDQPKLTLLPFLVEALAKALPDFPAMNARYDDEAGIVRRYEALHVGIATQTPNGLVVPVLRHAEARDLWDTAAEISRLAEAARSGKGTREELSGSTITISSLGPIGGIVTTPVINAPEVAIIGVNKIVEKPVVRGGQIVVRQCMNLSSSFDHRVIDGWDAARFIQRLRALLESPVTLLVR
ncbi:2-oxo acid dehydrogenase subunit E2 [Solimonas sp. K1W22B-7]|uniref:dihydrolipoamide acetyltransferase family protein n=1 Tax=Solimonas sp. K1W22B-7 TaxID=2303331 RepID=UPI000E335720|nr:dihydrolipoamide acetyltransferase family protein [Solimonas sp. K1W22B-7]AXQ30041.1 2-oxo acid dehydrogenase subunit E2 [Solimonas sp. K1W22B-7]